MDTMQNSIEPVDLSNGPHKRDGMYNPAKMQAATRIVVIAICRAIVFMCISTLTVNPYK
jgi:hypothetical protein